MSVKTWIDFWQEYTPQVGTTYHPRDLDELQKLAESHYKDSVRNWAKRLLEPRRENCDVDLKLTPTPYVGNLEKATIILAMLNPGIGEFDRIDHRNESFQDCLKEQRRQDSSALCFAVCDPDAVGFKSWTVFYRRFLRPTLEEIPNASWDSLAERLAIVQLFPYYSKNASLVLRGGYFAQLPSVKAAKKAMEALLSAPRKEVIFRWKRQPGRWGAKDGQGVCSEPRWGLSEGAKRAFARGFVAQP